MSKSECVWFCNLIGDTRDHLGMGTEETLDPVRKEAFFENIRAFERGEPMSPDRFPPFLYTYDKKQKKVPWRDLTVMGFWILSERYAEVFRHFDLGLGGLYPADIRLGDTKTHLFPHFILVNDIFTATYFNQ